MTTTTEATRVINQVAIEVVEVEDMVEVECIGPKEIDINRNVENVAEIIIEQRIVYFVNTATSQDILPLNVIVNKETINKGKGVKTKAKHITILKMKIKEKKNEDVKDMAGVQKKNKPVGELKKSTEKQLKEGLQQTPKVSDKQKRCSLV